MDNSPLQIEINTIASSFGCLSEKVEKFQRNVLSRNKQSPEVEHLIREVTGASAVLLSPDAGDMYASMVDNESVTKIAAAIATAHKTFMKVNEATSPSVSPSVLFIVQPGERNVADQRLLEAELWTAHTIPTEYRTLHEIQQTGRLDTHGNLVLQSPSSSSASLDGDLCVALGASVVSVAYFRAGYTPQDYPSPLEWAARALVRHKAMTV